MGVVATVDSGDAEVGALGLGLYSVADMSRLLGATGEVASPAKVARWARDGLVAHRKGQPEYSFLDLISVLVVAWLRRHGVGLPDIKAAEAYLSHEVGMKRPFAHHHIYTDGVNVLYRANPTIEDQITAANRGGQEVLAKTLTGVLKGVKYQNDLAAWWEIQDGVRIDPRIQFGDPCVTGRALRTSQVAGMQQAGESTQRIAEFYDLSTEAVERATQFEATLAAA
jgi:uncharacterized protein (DUF433 family)